MWPLFLGLSMATDVDVQFFSHLNGLNLGNNWGDLINVLDKALVIGLDFTQITAATIDEQGDVHLTFFAEHKALLFQVVELSGFTPEPLNQKYRIKGVPNSTQLILKPQNPITETTINTIGLGKLAPLGYEIVFTAQFKRVYRAKNPTTQHPFIRVDETISGLNGNYSDTYAKYAMVGLLEHMTHIDDYANPNVLQLPFDPSDPSKNWKITGIGTAVVRGWSRWYWLRGTSGATNSASDSTGLVSTNRNFTLAGDSNAFWFLPCSTTNGNNNSLYGAGLLLNTAQRLTAPWFLSSSISERNASTAWTQNNDTTIVHGVLLLNNMLVNLQNHVSGSAISGVSFSNTGRGNFANTASPFSMNAVGASLLHGALPHCYLSLNALASSNSATPIISDTSMYINQSISTGSSINIGGVHLYLGELE